MLVHRTLLASVLIASLLGAGCIKQRVKTIGELQTVESELTKKFGETAYVNVYEGRNSLVLAVSFINSVLNNKSHEQRFQRAAEAAKVVKAHYARISSVTKIWIGFVRQRSRLFVFHDYETLDSYPFNKEAQYAPLRPSATMTDGVPLETTANYDARRNESTVCVYGIQLEGEPGGNDGVTLLPNFTTTADINVKKGPPPKTVQFDFASYSTSSLAPRFEQVVPVTFIADEKTVFQTERTFYGDDAQFCYVPVPYRAFRKMIAARHVTIKLGAKEYSLTPRQLEAIRRMSEYVADEQSLR